MEYSIYAPTGRCGFFSELSRVKEKQELRRPAGLHTCTCCLDVGLHGCGGAVGTWVLPCDDSIAAASESSSIPGNVWTCLDSSELSDEKRMLLLYWIVLNTIVRPEEDKATQPCFVCPALMEGG